MDSGTRSAVGGGRAAAWAARGLPAVLIVYVAATHPVWTAAPLVVDLDPSWRAAYNHAFAQGWQFGSEFVFTFGPYGFLLSNTYHPETFAANVLLNVALAVVAAVAVFRWARQLGVHPVWAALAVVLLTDAAALAADGWLLALSTVPLFWLWGGSSPASRRLGWAMLLALAGALGLISLIKHSFAIAAAIVAVSCTVAELRQGRPPWFLIAYGLALAVFWLAAGQAPAHVLDYAESSLEIVGGYAEAMAQPGSDGEAAALMAAPLAYAGAVGLLFFRVHGRLGAVPAGGVLLVVLLLVKSSLLRQDLDHLDYLVGGITGLSALAGLAVLARWKVDRAPAASIAIAFGLHLAVCGWVLGTRGVVNPYPLSAALRWLDTPARIARAAGAIAHPGRLRERYEESRRAIRESLRLPPLAGGIDVVPDYISLALATEAEYRPRPVIQSYAAYAPALLERNRAFLAGLRAPRHLLYSVAEIDGRFPSQSDATSWPVLLTHYRIVGRAGAFRLMRRERRPRAFEIERLEARTVEFGQRVELPMPDAGEVLWAEIDLERTAWGEVIVALWRPPRVFLDVATRGAGVDRYRIVPGIVRSGFVLSPAVLTTEDFETLSGGTDGELWRSRVVDWIRLSTDDEGARPPTYHPSARLRLSLLRWERPPPRPPAGR